MADRATLEVTYFGARTKDQIAFASGPPTAICAGGGYVNLNRTGTKGWEVGYSVNVLSNFTVRGSYTFLEVTNRLTNALITTFPRNRRPGVQLAAAGQEQHQLRPRIPRQDRVAGRHQQGPVLSDRRPAGRPHDHQEHPALRPIDNCSTPSTRPATASAPRGAPPTSARGSPTDHVRGAFLPSRRKRRRPPVAHGRRRLRRSGRRRPAQGPHSRPRPGSTPRASSRPAASPGQTSRSRSKTPAARARS